MKVSCENCGATYNIPESKLVKEVNKATCRKCGHRMLIRKSVAPAASFKGPDHDEQTLISQASAIGLGMAPEPAPRAQEPAFRAEPPRPEPQPQAEPPRFAAESRPGFGQDPRQGFAAQPVPMVEQPRPMETGRSMPGRGVWKEEIEEPITPAVEYASPSPAPVAAPPIPQRAEPAPQRPIAPAIPAAPAHSAPVRPPAPAQSAAPARAPAPAQDLSGDMSVVMLAGLLSAVGTVILAATAGSQVLFSFGGLFLALLGSLTTILVVITSNWGRQRAKVFISLLVSLLLSVLLSGLLSLRVSDLIGTLRGSADNLAKSALENAVEEPEEPEVASSPSALEPATQPATVVEPPEPAKEAPAPAPEQNTATAATAPQRGATTSSTESSTPARSSTTSSSTGTSSSTPPRSTSSGGSTGGRTTTTASTESTESAPAATSTASDMDTVKKVISLQIRNNKNVKTCFGDERKRSGSLPSITMQFTIQPSGSVTSVSAAETAMRGTELESCLSGAISSITGPPFSGESLRTSFPFRF